MIKLSAILLAFFFIGSMPSLLKNNGTVRAWYDCSENINLDTSTIKAEENRVYFDFHLDETPDFSVDGYHLGEVDAKDYFTAYFINTTDSIFTAKRQDGSLMIIQEAKTENGEWKPIEHWIYSGCGNSYFRPLLLQPNEYVKVPIRKYNGRLKTQIRLKMKKDSTIFYSDSFDASINPSQFEPETEKARGILYFGDVDYFETEK